MKTPDHDLGQLKSNPDCPLSPMTTGAMTLKARILRLDTLEEDLLPYEKVAKAVYVKANGLPAYYKATGKSRYSHMVMKLNEK
jgi:hypothetical protein